MVAGGSRTLNWSSPELVLPFWVSRTREFATRAEQHEPNTPGSEFATCRLRVPVRVFTFLTQQSTVPCVQCSLYRVTVHVPHSAVHCTMSSLYHVHCTMSSLLDEFGQFCSRPCVHAPHSAVHCTVCSQYCTVYSRSPLSSPLYRVFTVRRVRTVLSKLQSWKRARRWTPQPAILSKVSSNRVTDLFVGARIIHLERSDCAYGDRVVYPLRDVVRSCSVL